MQKSQQITLVALFIGMGLILPLLFHYYSIEYFTFKLKHAYCDFHALLNSIHSLDPYHYHATQGIDLPFSYLIMLPFLWLKKEIALMIYLFIFLIGFSFFNWYFLVKKTINTNTTYGFLTTIGCLFAYTIFSFPAIEALLTANIEIYAFLFLATFLFLYLKKQFGLSTIFLSAAIAMKLYPAIFLLLYFSNRQFKELSIACLLSLALIFLSLCFFKSSGIESIVAYFHNLNWYNEYFVHTVRGITHSTSFFAFSRVTSHLIHHADLTYPTAVSDLHRWLYFLISLIFFSFVALYVIVFETIFWRKILLLTCTMLLLPFVVFYYKLIYLYLPFYAFIHDNEKDHETSLFYFTYLIIFAILFIPKEYFPVGANTISTLLNPLLMLLIMSLAVIDKIYSRYSH